MKKALFLVLIATTVFTTATFAQAEGSSYTNAIGVKFWPGALSFKHFTTDNTALEGLLNFWDNGFRITGLYEFHGNIEAAPGLRWYVGPGAHIGWWNGAIYHDHYYNSGSLMIGVDGVLGLEYKFEGAPIAVSADIQPYLEFNHPYLGIWGGLGVKYTW
jgi:hypothetical protein